MITPQPQLLTTAEVAALFRVDKKTVTRWAAAGRLPCIRTPGGTAYRYEKTAIDALISGVTPPPGTLEES